MVREPKRIEDKVVAVLELMKINLAETLTEERKGFPIEGWSPTKKTICAFGMAFVIEYVHSRRLVQCDFKPDNIFLNDQLQPVVGDFGSARRVDPGEKLDDEHPLSGDDYLYISAPDVLAADVYDLSIDVYAFGVNLYSLFHGPSPLVLERIGELQTFDTRLLQTQRTVVIDLIKQGATLARVPEIPDKYWELTKDCWTIDSSQRPTFTEIVDLMLENVDW
jgi:serine/threonine protein kinase